MSNTLLRRMTGEELLVLRILQGEQSAAAISGELDRRARCYPARRMGRSVDWSSRIFAARQSARLQTAA
jgi:hypothetical protein